MIHNGIIRNNHDDQPWLALKVRWNELPRLEWPAGMSLQVVLQVLQVLVVVA